MLDKLCLKIKSLVKGQKSSRTTSAYPDMTPNQQKTEIYNNISSVLENRPNIPNRSRISNRKNPDPYVNIPDFTFVTSSEEIQPNNRNTNYPRIEQSLFNTPETQCSDYIKIPEFVNINVAQPIPTNQVNNNNNNYNNLPEFLDAEINSQKSPILEIRKTSKESRKMNPLIPNNNKPKTNNYRWSSYQIEERPMPDTKLFSKYPGNSRASVFVKIPDYLQDD